MPVWKANFLQKVRIIVNFELETFHCISESVVRVQTAHRVRNLCVVQQVDGAACVGRTGGGSAISVMEHPTWSCAVLQHSIAPNYSLQ